ncbi:LOW QUALITY PROTEIN: hypothetical protein V1477_008354 [Vespula maculifrons]|uniref:Uncharacterized protein n=1 Tax=Vespula maculifrons TaxID=7453 RepID=A0ABD2CCU4_VESMC
MCQEVAREIPPLPSHSLPPDKNSNICYSVQFSRKLRFVTGSYDVPGGGTRNSPTSSVQFSRKLRFDHMMCQKVAREIAPPPGHSLHPDKNSNFCHSVQFSRKLRFVTGSYDVPEGGTRNCPTSRSLITS